MAELQVKVKTAVADYGHSLFHINMRNILFGLIFLLFVAACQPIAPPLSTVPVEETAVPPAVTSTPPPEPSATVQPHPSDTPQPMPSATSTPAVTPTVTVPPTATATDQPLQPIGPFQEIATMEQLVTGNFAAIHTSLTGDLFYATTGEVLRFNGRQWETYLANYEGDFVGIDSLDRVWVQPSGDEIAAWDGSEWHTFGVETGWATTRFVPQQDIVTDHLGQIWLATSDDIRLFAAGIWQVFTADALGLTPLTDEDNDTTYTITFVPQTNEVWVGQCNWLTGNPLNGGLSIFKNAQWQPTLVREHTPCVLTMAITADNQIWLNSASTLFQFDLATGSWQQHLPPEGAYGRLTSLNFDNQNRPWASWAECVQGSCDIQEDLFRLDNGRWTLIADDETEYSPYTQVVAHDDNTWIFLKSTVYEINDDQLILVVENFPGRAIVDEDGRLWVVSLVDNQLYLWQFIAE